MRPFSTSIWSNVSVVTTCSNWQVNLTLMLLVTNLAITKLCKILWKWLKPWQMGPYLRVFSESYLMNTNMTGLDDSQKALRPCALDKSSFSIDRAKIVCYPFFVHLPAFSSWRRPLGCFRTRSRLRRLLRSILRQAWEPPYSYHHPCTYLLMFLRQKTLLLGCYLVLSLSLSSLDILHGYLEKTQKNYLD